MIPARLLTETSVLYCCAPGMAPSCVLKS